MDEQMYENVDNVEIIVDKKKKEFIKLPEKEWILTEIVEVKKQLPTKAGWNANFNWTFIIKEPGYENRKIWYNTSMIAVPESKFYSLYLEVMGLKDLDDGAIIKPTDLLNKKCYIMVVQSRKNKDRQLISEIKNYKEEQKSEKEVVSVTSKSEKVNSEKEGKVISKDVKKTEEELENIDEITFDDIK